MCLSCAAGKERRGGGRGEISVLLLGQETAAGVGKLLDEEASVGVGLLWWEGEE